MTFRVAEIRKNPKYLFWEHYHMIRQRKRPNAKEAKTLKVMIAEKMDRLFLRLESLVDQNIAKLDVEQQTPTPHVLRRHARTK